MLQGDNKVFNFYCLVLITFIYLLYKDESMCVYVCMCVCPAACRRTHTSYHPKIWRGLLISPGLGTKLGGNPKCWPPAPPTAPPTFDP